MIDILARDREIGKGCDFEEIWRQYCAGMSFKNSVGERGLYRQTEMNERFFVGDQWSGVNCGGNKPLVRYNIIKRIADYKLAVVGGRDISVRFTAEGVPYREAEVEAFSKLGLSSGAVKEDEAAGITRLFSHYFNVSAERVNFDDIKEVALRNAYVSGTGIVYTWWDNTVSTGLYADSEEAIPVMGDIACEVLDVENVYFGDPSVDDLQRQPYIIISQRRRVEELKADARRNGVSEHIIKRIKPDYSFEAGALDDGAKKTTVLTKLWKEWDQRAGGYVVNAVQVFEGGVIKLPWSLGVRLYLLAAFCWERKRGLGYGVSEILRLFVMLWGELSVFLFWLPYLKQGSLFVPLPCRGLRGFALWRLLISPGFLPGFRWGLIFLRRLHPLPLGYRGLYLCSCLRHFFRFEFLMPERLYPRETALCDEAFFCCGAI